MKQTQICLMYFTLRQVDWNLHHWIKLGELTPAFSCRIHHLLTGGCGVGNS